MAEAKAVNQTSRPRRWYRPSLTKRILIGLVFGGVLGYISPKWGNNVYFLRDIFLNLIKSIIAPLIFSTLVVGIAGGGDLKKVGRMGAKAILYFEIVTTLALFIGLAVVNFTKPGAGVALVGGGDITSLVKTQPQGFRDLLVHIFPASVFDSMVRAGDPNGPRPPRVAGFHHRKAAGHEPRTSKGARRASEPAADQGAMTTSSGAERGPSRASSWIT